ncbi:hypothetical protein SISNIDRAFT_483852 [Sistotremastrum niveocremeum HHB9708]|uniref:FAD/NAD(P)-binding domain-containing protein n=1 Tax=Sistotremastrum niveocremeum HHB9708 TaxID=1314777 RepID=A0A164X4J1_9AGAM|nr:hypothetical protein SISNIDRAFT_483852 [Sistotremastrum niveocremeum HHB9708]
MAVPLEPMLPRPRILLSLFIAAVFVLLFRAYVFRRRHWKTGQITILHELADLGKAGQGGRLIDGTVVIAGGSLAGLLTARVCSTHFARVLVVEPDASLSSSTGPSDRTRVNPRPRVMQYTSAHNYHVLTLWALRELFPEFEAEVLKIDPQAIVPSDRNLYIGCFAKALGRATYETLLRKLVKRKCHNVEFLSGLVTGIKTEDPASPELIGLNRIRSVTIRSNDGSEITEPALLLVDCTGSAQAGFKWLSSATKSLKIPKEVYDPKICVTNCVYEVDPDIMDKLQIPGGYANARTIFTGVSDARLQQDPRGLYILKREHNMVHISCGGFDIFDRPRSIDDVRAVFSNFASGGSVPAYVFQLLDILEDKCEASAEYIDAKCAPFSFVKYHEVSEQLPNNFIAIGDSVMTLNPVRGQGCTKAMIGAVTLNGILQDCQHISRAQASGEVLPEDFGSKFWASQHKRTSSFWTDGKASDYSWDTTIPVEGESLKDGAFLRWYQRNLLDVASKNENVAVVLYDISMLITPGCYAIRPGIAIRVLWAGLKEYLGFGPFGPFGL